MKTEINLYTSEFQPKRQLFSLTHMVWLWGSVLLVLSAIGLYSYWLLIIQSEQALALKNDLTSAQNEIRRLNEKLENHKASPILLAELKEKQTQVAGWQLMLQRLDELAPEKVGSYANLMMDLTQIQSNQLSLYGIQVTEGEINLAGVTRSSQDVPAWVDRFKETHALQGKQFTEMELVRDEQGHLHFSLTGIPQEKNKKR